MKSRYRLNDETEVLVSPAEKKVLDFIKNKLPEDVAIAYFALPLNDIIRILKQNKDSGHIPHWGINQDLTKKYMWHGSDWFNTKPAKELNSLLSAVEAEKEFEEKKIDRYEKSSSRYQGYLEAKIEKAVNQINNKNILTDLYETLIKTQFGGSAQIPDNISESKATIASNLLNQYRYGDDQQRTLIEQKLSTEPKLVADLKKRNVICEATSKLQKSGNVTKDELEKNFFKHLKDNKSILTKRRDSGFDTFVKGLGVAVATIFGVGVGGYFAYKHLFGSKATEGGKLINEVKDIRKSHPKR
jgi:hypothetical protein